MTGFLSACHLLADFVDDDLDCSEELLSAIFHLARPMHALFYTLDKSLLTSVSDGTSAIRKTLHRDALSFSCDDEVIIYPRVISSSDPASPWELADACSTSSSILQSALCRITEVVKAHTTKGDIWRVWVTLAEHDHSVYLSLTLSDPFKRIDFTYRYNQKEFLPIRNGLHSHGLVYKLKKGRFSVDDTVFETEGNFVYNFVSRIIPSSRETLFYAEAGHLMKVTINLETKTASALHYRLAGDPTVINIFPWGSEALGILVTTQGGGYEIRIITKELSELEIPGLPDLKGYKLFGAALDRKMQIHLLPSNSPEVLILSPHFDLHSSLLH